MYRLRFPIILILFAFGGSIYAQDSTKLPYRTIPEYPDQYTAATTIARMIDGLGFRYYWATEGLRPEDMDYRPNEEARSMDETIDHILNLCLITSHAIQQIPFEGFDASEMTFLAKRKLTLEQLQIASNILKSDQEASLEEMPIIFKSTGDSTIYPFWNVVNGPLSDALWHVGQVVSFRRSSGNPFDPRVDVLEGKVMGE